MLRSLYPALILVLMAAAACQKDPHDPETWIEKLDDPADLDEAVRHLERLKHPSAIAPLAWIAS